MAVLPFAHLSEKSVDDEKGRDEVRLDGFYEFPGVIDSSGETRKNPALLTMMCGASPNSDRTTAAAAATDAASVTSQRTGSARPPISAASVLSASAFRASNATRAPRAESDRAISAPMPRDAPVTSAVRDASPTAVNL